MSRPPHAAPLRRAMVVAAALASVVLLGAVVFGSRGLLHLRALRTEQRDHDQRIASLLRENEQLRTTVRRLRNDDRYVERLARERLGFARPGEIVHRFPARDQAPASRR